MCLTKQWSILRFKHHLHRYQVWTQQELNSLNCSKHTHTHTRTHAHTRTHTHTHTRTHIHTHARTHAHTHTYTGAAPAPTAGADYYAQQVSRSRAELTRHSVRERMKNQSPPLCPPDLLFPLERLQCVHVCMCVCVCVCAYMHTCE